MCVLASSLSSQRVDICSSNQRAHKVVVSLQTNTTTIAAPVVNIDPAPEPKLVFRGLHLHPLTRLPTRPSLYLHVRPEAMRRPLLRTDGNGLGKRKVSTPCAFRSHAYEDEKPRGREMDMAWDDLDEEDMTEPESVFDTGVHDDDND